MILPYELPWAYTILAIFDALVVVVGYGLLYVAGVLLMGYGMEKVSNLWTRMRE